MPARLAATLAAGLPDEARIRGTKVKPEIILLAACVDRLSDLVWMQTEDARKKKNRPSSVLAEILGPKKEEKAFNTPKEYENAWAAITGVRHNGH